MVARGSRTRPPVWVARWVCRCGSGRPGRCGAMWRSSPSDIASGRGSPGAVGASRSARACGTDRCNISSPAGVRISMETKRRLIPVILIVASLWNMLHVYVRQRWLAQTPLAPAWRLFGWVGILLLVVAPFVALFAGRSERLPAKRGLEVAGFTALGLSSLLIVFALAGDVLHLRVWLGAGGFSAAVVGGAVAVLVIGLLRAGRAPVGRVVAVPGSALTPDVEQFPISHPSAQHLRA